MHILGGGRNAFLEFLRNLTPLALLASIALVAWAQLDFRRFDPSNWVTTAVFYVCALASVLSFWANLTLFLEKAFLPPFALDRVAKRLKVRHRSPTTLLRLLLALAFRKKPLAILEVLVVALVLYGAVLAASMSALRVANKTVAMSARR